MQYIKYFHNKNYMEKNRYLHLCISLSFFFSHIFLYSYNYNFHTKIKCNQINKNLYYMTFNTIGNASTHMQVY